MIQSIRVLDTRSRTLRDDVPAAELAGFLASREHVVWVDIEAPTPEDLAFLAAHFRFHPLALEDCAHRHQRPKVDVYEGYFFIVLYDAEYHGRHGLVLRELDLFWGANYVVTVHAEPVDDLVPALERWRASELQSRRTAGFLTYLITDTIVDDYFPVIECISERIEDLEDSIFEAFDKRAIQRIFALKKELITLRKAVVPLRDVFILLSRREVGLVDAQTQPYLQDVYDHLIRVSDSIDTYRDLITSTIDAYLSAVSNRTNEVMRRLTILSTILLTPAVFAGIWGMNFQYMPELAWPNGYPLALALMLAVILLELIIFRRLDYF